MIYCKECGYKAKDGLDKCPKCGHELVAELQEDEVRPLVQKIHKKQNKLRETTSSGLSMVVIGAILLIIGLLFYRLSSKLDKTITDRAVYRVVTTCAEFWVSMISLFAGGALLIIGTALALYSFFKRKSSLKDIDFIRKNQTALIGIKK